MTDQAAQTGETRRVVVCIDETEISHKAVHWCLKSVINADADLVTVLHVVTEPVKQLKEFRQVGSSKSPAELGIGSPRDTKLIDIVEKYLSDLEKKTGKAVKCVYCDVYHHDAREAIVEFCKEYNASLVVTGKRDLTAMQSIGKTSVSKFVVKKATCVVMVFDKQKEIAYDEMENAKTVGLTEEEFQVTPAPPPQEDAVETKNIGSITVFTQEAVQDAPSPAQEVSKPAQTANAGSGTAFAHEAAQSHEGSQTENSAADLARQPSLSHGEQVDAETKKEV